jgi:hypothetical protein
MLTYSKIGHFGRLGNQMFQFAGTYGIARKQGYDIAFPKENIYNPVTEHFKDGISRECTFDIPKVFTLNDTVIRSKSEIVTVDTIQEPFFHFTKDFFNIPDNIDLRGYYQTDKYFKHVENEIRDMFTFKPEIIESANDLFPNTDTETVAIHVRIGDYIGLEAFHPICSPEYYVSATNEFLDKDYTFIIFSDNIEYCKEHLFGYQTNIHYIDNTDPYIDLCLMTMCDHNIIANSSFSWWGAWLNKNPNKKVIAPKQWFGPAYQYSHNTADLYCDTWIIK